MFSAFVFLLGINFEQWSMCEAQRLKEKWWGHLDTLALCTVKYGQHYLTLPGVPSNLIVFNENCDSFQGAWPLGIPEIQQCWCWLRTSITRNCWYPGVFYTSQWLWTIINFLHAAKSAVQWSSICQEIRSTLCVFSVLCSLPITSAAPSPHLHLLALFLAGVSASSTMQLLFLVMGLLSLLLNDVTYRYIADWE